MTADTPKPEVADRMAAARAARAAKKVAEPKADTPKPEVAEATADELPAGPTILQRVAANQAEKRAAKIAALRAAKVAGPDTTTEPVVQCRVLKRGHGLISMGEHVGGLGDLTYDHGEIASLPQSIAKELEAKDYVEIQ